MSVWAHQVSQETADRKTIINYISGYQMGKTIIDYHKKFEHVQSMWLLMAVSDSWW